MICSALLIEKRGPTCRDPRGAVRVNAIAEDFEHDQDHLVKIFTCVLLRGLARALEKFQTVALMKCPRSMKRGHVRLRNVVLCDSAGCWMEKLSQGG